MTPPIPKKRAQRAAILQTQMLPILLLLDLRTIMSCKNLKSYQCQVEVLWRYTIPQLQKYHHMHNYRGLYIAQKLPASKQGSGSHIEWFKPDSGDLLLSLPSGFAHTC